MLLVGRWIRWLGNVSSNLNYSVTDFTHLSWPFVGYITGYCLLVQQESLICCSSYSKTSCFCPGVWVPSSLVFNVAISAVGVCWRGSDEGKSCKINHSQSGDEEKWDKKQNFVVILLGDCCSYSSQSNANCSPRSVGNEEGHPVGRTAPEILMQIFFSTLLFINLPCAILTRREWHFVLTLMQPLWAAWAPRWITHSRGAAEWGVQSFYSMGSCMHQTLKDSI